MSIKTDILLSLSFHIRLMDRITPGKGSKVVLLRKEDYDAIKELLIDCKVEIEKQ